MDCPEITEKMVYPELMVSREMLENVSNKAAQTVLLEREDQLEILDRRVLMALSVEMVLRVTQVRRDYLAKTLNQDVKEKREIAVSPETTVYLAYQEKRALLAVRD